MRHRDAYHHMYEKLHNEPVLRYVTTELDPDKDAIAFETDKNGPFTPKAKRTYRELVSELSAAEAESIRIFRSTDGRGNPMEATGFLIFGRGIGGDTEGIMIEHTVGIDPSSKYFQGTTCAPLADKTWYICHSR